MSTPPLIAIAGFREVFYFEKPSRQLLLTLAHALAIDHTRDTCSTLSLPFFVTWVLDRAFIALVES